jgi:hypothetical protein
VLLTCAKNSAPVKARDITRACFSRFGRVVTRATPLALALLLSGCATNHLVQVDSLARPRIGTASYVLKASGPLTEIDSLRAQELAGQVRTALARRGMFEAPPNITPDVVVELDCGVNSLPLKPKLIPGPLDRPGPWVTPAERVPAGTDENGKPIYVGREILRTDYGYYEMVPVYEKYLRLSAHENAAPTAGRPPAEVWRVDAAVEGESPDLRKALPILVAATIDYIGSDSHGQKTVRIKEPNAPASGAQRRF